MITMAYQGKFYKRKKHAIVKNREKVYRLKPEGFNHSQYKIDFKFRKLKNDTDRKNYE
jgi:hypothetical protein